MSEITDGTCSHHGSDSWKGLANANQVPKRFFPPVTRTGKILNFYNNHNNNNNNNNHKNKQQQQQQQ